MSKKLLFLFFTFFFVESNAEKNCFFQACYQCDTSCDSFDNDNTTKTFFSMRPQDSNTARDILKQSNINNCLIRCYHTIGHKDWLFFNVTTEYQQSFDAHTLAQWFFGKNCLSVGIPDATQCFDINGTQIGMHTAPGQKIGTICFKPTLNNTIIDFDTTIHLNKWLCTDGLWFRIKLPVVHAQTNLHECQCMISTSTAPFEMGFYSNDCLQTTPPFTCISHAINDKKGFGDIPPLHCGRIIPCKQTKTALAAVHLDFGYDFIKNENGYFASSLHIAIPTAPAPHAHTLFEPTIGANKSWQVGTTIIGSYTNNTVKHIDCISLTSYSILTHVFKSNQSRLFNLRCNGPLSQFLLLKKFNPTISEVLQGQRVANILCGHTKIGASVMFDSSLALDITRRNLIATIGYNFWVRSHEKRSPVICFNDFTPRTYGIKGDTYFSDELIIPCPTGCPQPFQIVCNHDVKTASCSTLCRSANPDAKTVFLEIDAVNVNAPLQPTALSHKIFGRLGYTWQTQHYEGLLSCAGEVEFGQNDAALNQWGIQITFGVSI